MTDPEIRALALLLEVGDWCRSGRSTDPETPMVHGLIANRLCDAGFAERADVPVGRLFRTVYRITESGRLALGSRRPRAQRRDCRYCGECVAYYDASEAPGEGEHRHCRAAYDAGARAERERWEVAVKGTGEPGGSMTNEEFYAWLFRTRGKGDADGD